MTDEKLVEKLAKAMYESASAVTFVGGLTIEEQWEVVDQDERDLCYAHARAALAHLKYDELAKRAELCDEMADMLRLLFTAVRAFHAEENYDFPELGGKVNTGNRYPAMQDCATDAATIIRKYDALEKGGS